MGKPLCDHPDFEAVVTVNRIEDKGLFMADVQVRCSACKVRFCFAGLEAGMSYREPMTSVDGFELRAPIVADAHTTMLMAGDSDCGFPGDAARLPDAETTTSEATNGEWLKYACADCEFASSNPVALSAHLNWSGHSRKTEAAK